jgi:acyl dehydratase
MRPGESRVDVLTEDLTRTQIVQYAGASGDYNPVHTDEVFATRAAGFPSVFAHGMLTMAMTARAVTDWVGHDALTSYGVRFKRQVWPGDRLVATVTVEKVRVDEDGHRVADLIVSTANGDGEEVVSGYATARIADPPSSQSAGGEF